MKDEYQVCPGELATVLLNQNVVRVGVLKFSGRLDWVEPFSIEIMLRQLPFAFS